MELDLLIDDIVNELPLDDKLRREILEPPDFFGINYCSGFDVRCDVFKIVLPLATVPDPVFGERPCIDFMKKRIKICHIVFIGRTIPK
jgi:hypothetical protein